ncbi:hypothetical protein NRA64_08015 [Acinetobacter baumannii]|nr:hypothetical protein [Acinetobacter baumannii]
MTNNVANSQALVDLLGQISLEEKMTQFIQVLPMTLNFANS